MHPHDPNHDALLERIVVGDLAPSSPEARALLDVCGSCSERFREFEKLQASLARAGLDERAGVSESLSCELTPGMEQGLKRFAESRTHVQPMRSRWVRVATVTLAASVVGVLGYQFFARSGSDGPVHEEHPLGGPKVPVGTSPRGVLQGEIWDEFTWTARALLPGESFILIITNLDQPALDPLIVDRIGGTSWKRSAPRLVESRSVEEFFAHNPRRIEWQVEIRSGLNRVAGKPVQASLD